MTMRTELGPLREDEEAGRPLTWRAWLLVPLAAFALMGVVVPLTRETRGSPSDLSFLRDRDAAPEEALVPYADELVELLDRPDIDALARKVILRLHEQAAAQAKKHGGRITESLRGDVDRQLDAYR